MSRRGDRGRRLTSAERLELRRRVARGEKLETVAAAVGCSTKSVQRLLARTGGLPPPRSRLRSPLRLSWAEREEISRGLLAGESFRAIATGLGRAPSTVSRDVGANGARARYRAWRAEETAARGARRPKVAKLARCERLRQEVERLLDARWSPQQIAHRLVRNSSITISVYIRQWIVQSLADLGRFAEAAPYEAELLQLAGPTQHAHTVGSVYSAAGMLHLRMGDWLTARSLYEQSIVALRTGNIAIMLPITVAASAWVLAQVGAASEALCRLREGEQLLERQAAQGMAQGLVFTSYQSLGRAALLLDRLDEAQSLGERAVRSSASRHGVAAHALRLLGDIATYPERFDAESGEVHYRNALALAEPRGMRPLVAHCHLGLGKLYRRTGHHEQAHEHLTTATTMYREMDMPYWLEQAEAEVRELA